MSSSARSGDPLVSVVMPAYNAAAYIEESVRSILAQTVADLELIVVDDGSTDGTAAIVESIGDPRTRIVQADHGGEGAARNGGLDAARGRFIVWNDADDTAMAQRLERMLCAMVDGVDFVHHDMLFMDPSGRETGYQRASNIAREHVLPYYLREGCPYNCNTTMLRRSSVGMLRHADDIRIGVDVDFMRRFAPTRNGVHVPEPLMLYRRHPASALATMARGDDYPHVQRLLEEEPLEALVPDAFQDEWPDEGRLVAQAYVVLCLLRRGFERPAEALADAITRQPVGPAAATVMSAMFHLAMREPREALAKVAHAAPNALTANLRGDALAMLGDLAGASAAYRRAAQSSPGSYDAAAGLRATGEALGLWVLDDPRRRLLGLPNR